MPLNDAITTITNQISTLSFNPLSVDDVAKYQALFLQLVEACNASRMPNNTAIATLREAYDIVLGWLNDEDLTDLSNVSTRRNYIKLLANINDAIDNNTVISTYITVSDADVITVDAAISNNFYVVLDPSRASRTINPPLNPLGDGQFLIIRVKTTASGQTLTLNTGAGGFGFSDSAPEDIFAISTDADKIDYFSSRYDSFANKWHVQALMNGF